MISPDTIVFAVRSLIRVGSAARSAYEQKVRDAPIAEPNWPQPQISSDDDLRGFFELKADRLEATKEHWKDKKPKSPEDRRRLIELRKSYLAAEPDTPAAGFIRSRLVEEEDAITVIDQWAAGKEPPDPAVRIALAFADVALDYVSANPGILGVGGNGEKLIASLSGNLKALIPDVDNSATWNAKDWGRFYFAERALAIMLHAGLKTIGEHPDLAVKDKHYSELLRNVLSPFTKAFEQNPNRRPQWIELRDLLLGPMTDAALATLAKNQRAFLGGAFDPSQAVGAITEAILTAAAEDSLTDFGNEDLVRLYQATLTVAAARPELFFDSGGALKPLLARELLANVAGRLKNAPPPFRGGVAANLAIAALEIVANDVPRRIDASDPWEKLAGNLVQELLDGLSAGLQTSPDALLHIFSPDQATELVRIVMAQAARTPGMVTGKAARGEVRMLVACLAKAMAAPGASLLSAEDWLKVGTIVAEEAARNPLRLFSIGAADKPEGQLLARLMMALFETAAAQFKDGKGRSQSAVLFGETLREAIRLALRTAAGNAERATAHVDALIIFVGHLNQLLATMPLRVGAREWLYVYERYIGRVLDGAAMEPLTADRLLGDLELGEDGT